MFKKKTKIKSLGFAAIITTLVAILFCVLPSCISPEAFQTEIQGIRLDMEGMEKVTDQLSVWQKTVQAEIINYGGAGYVVIGTGAMALIFVVPGFLLIRAFMKRGSMLALLTKAVKETQKDHLQGVMAIKENLKYSVKEGHFCEKDRKNLGIFAKKRGYYVEQKPEFEV